MGDELRYSGVKCPTSRLYQQSAPDTINQLVAFVLLNLERTGTLDELARSPHEEASSSLRSLDLADPSPAARAGLSASNVHDI